MKKIGVFYSFNTRNTTKAVVKIMEAFGNQNIEAVNVENITLPQLLAFDNLILGVPTWFDGELPNYWDEFMPALEEGDLHGKTIAIFGHGDQVGYSENFADAIGILAEAVEERGAKLIGQTQPESYEFERSYALKKGVFLGLVLDDENQSELTDDRIKRWVEVLKKEFK